MLFRKSSNLFSTILIVTLNAEINLFIWVYEWLMVSSKYMVRHALPYCNDTFRTVCLASTIKSVVFVFCLTTEYQWQSLDSHYSIYVLSINNSRFAEFLPLIYPPELEVKETIDTASSASFLDLYLEFDDSGHLSTKIYDKRDEICAAIYQLLLHMVFTSRN